MKQVAILNTKEYPREPSAEKPVAAVCYICENRFFVSEIKSQEMKQDYYYHGVCGGQVRPAYRIKYLKKEIK